MMEFFFSHFEAMLYDQDFTSPYAKQIFFSAELIDNEDYKTI